MILEDVKDQLIIDPQLNLVAADKPFVVILIAVEGNHLALCGICFKKRTQEESSLFDHCANCWHLAVDTFIHCVRR